MEALWRLANLLPSGSVVYVESEYDETGEQRASIQTLFGPGEDGKSPTFSDRIAPIVEALETIRNGLVTMAPSETTLKASMKFVGSGGVILTSYKAEPVSRSN